jgi:hypothetical protein
MGSRLTQRSRATMALVAIALWLAGVELLPNAHLARHEADHTHDTSGAVVRSSAGAESRTIRYSHARRSAKAERHSHAVKWSPNNRAQAQLVDAGHGAHDASGLAHRAVALQEPAPPITRPVPVEQLLAWVITDVTTDRILDTELAQPSARGPPAA